MENNGNVLKDDELEKVSGGTHLTSSETREAQPGDYFIIEDSWGVNLAECKYMGEIYDPGGAYYLKLHVLITKVYNPSGMFELRGNTYYEGTDEWISRIDLDFPYIAQIVSSFDRYKIKSNIKSTVQQMKKAISPNLQ